MERLDLQMWIG